MWTNELTPGPFTWMKDVQSGHPTGGSLRPLKALEVAEALEPWRAGGSGLCAPLEKPASSCGVARNPKAPAPSAGEGPCKPMLSDEAEPRALQGLPGDGRESFTISQSLPKFMYIALVMPYIHLIL